MIRAVHLIQVFKINEGRKWLYGNIKVLMCIALSSVDGNELTIHKGNIGRCLLESKSPFRKVLNRDNVCLWFKALWSMSGVAYTHKMPSYVSVPNMKNLQSKSAWSISCPDSHTCSQKWKDWFNMIWLFYIADMSGHGRKTLNIRWFPAISHPNAELITGNGHLDPWRGSPGVNKDWGLGAHYPSALPCWGSSASGRCSWKFTYSCSRELYTGA